MPSATRASLPPATVFVPSRYSAWLLRPLLDLGPFEQGPLYAQAVDHYWLALLTPSLPRFALQRTLAPGFRDAMLREAGRSSWSVVDPRELAPAHRTDRWHTLCEMLDAWSILQVETRCRLVLLLHALCLHECVVSLPVALPANPDAAEPDSVELAYWAAVSRYMVQMPASFDRYRDADLSTFIAIGHRARHAQPTAFNAATKVFVHLAKTGASADQLRRADAVMAARLDDALHGANPFTAGLLTSRFHRARSFLPMKRGDRDGVVREMALAERLARELQPSTPAQALLAAENLHPVLESRAKEALWLGDPDLALARSREVTELDPHDPKSWLELGNLLLSLQRLDEAAEAFVTAAMLGPPVGAMARHMAGTCLRRGGSEVLAAFFFQSALELDPDGVSPRSALAAGPEHPALASVRTWSSYRFDASA